MRKIFVLPALILCILACACAKKAPRTPPSSAASPQEIADIREFPQNLEVYAREAGKNKRILSAAVQDSLSAAFANTYFGPWQMRKTSISRREAATGLGRAWGYKNDCVPWTRAELDAIRANANLSAFPSRAAAAITVRQTDLREIPTRLPRFSEPVPDPEAYPFDNIQYSFLQPGTPLLIAHTSADGAWHYVECPIAGGWVAARDVALADEAFRARWLTGEYAALVAEKVKLPSGAAGIGTVLPLTGRGARLKALAPGRDAGGYARAIEISFAPGEAAVMPMPLTPGNVAAVGDKMMGQPYGWGGMHGNRDCSSMIRDLFTPFGIWLPRNSAAQARRGQVTRLDGMSASQKAQIIMAEGRPFLSLVGMPGHITLYVGRWKNRPALFHNIWGLRIIRDGDDDERFVIGRAVVTSITPGMELKNLYRPRTFADRIRTLSTPGQR